MRTKWFVNSLYQVCGKLIFCKPETNTGHPAHPILFVFAQKPTNFGLRGQCVNHSQMVQRMFAVPSTHTCIWYACVYRDLHAYNLWFYSNSLDCRVKNWCLLKKRLEYGRKTSEKQVLCARKTSDLPKSIRTLATIIRACEAIWVSLTHFTRILAKNLNMLERTLRRWNSVCAAYFIFKDHDFMSSYTKN